MIRTFLLALALAQTQTPAQIVDQITGLLQQLKVALASSQITTSAQLTAACTSGGAFTLAPATFTVNCVAAKPLTLTGPREAVLVPADPLSPVLAVPTAAASGSRFSGFTIRNGAADRTVAVVGLSSATSADAQPSHVTLTDLAFEAGPNGGHRAIELHGADLIATFNRITNFWEKGRDSQGIYALNGPGPYTIDDNYIEASGEGILVGGDSIKIPNLVPANISIRRNHVVKLDAWRKGSGLPGDGAVVKNQVEIKASEHVTIEGNLLENVYGAQGQDGTPIVLTVRDQKGDNPWVVVDDVTVRGNTVKRCTGFAVSILGSDNNFPTRQTQTVTIEGNDFEDCPSGMRIIAGVARLLTVRRNSFLGITGNFLSYDDWRGAAAVKTPLVWTENVIRSGAYGITAATTGPGIATLNLWSPGATFTGNVIEATSLTQLPPRTIAYPPGNTVVPPGGLEALLDPVTHRLRSGLAGY